jgi:hypothetical protein
MTLYARIPKLGNFSVLANIRKKRFNFRFTTTHFTVFSMFARSQRLEGISSQVFDQNGQPTGNHMIFWDCEEATIDEIKDTLRKVQRRYHLSHIYIASDNGTSFRAWCFSVVSLKTFLKILIDSLDILDYGFLYYTLKRKEATLRTNGKEGRPFQNCIAILDSYFVPFPSGIVNHVIYYTGCEKRGTSFVLGGN